LLKVILGRTDLCTQCFSSSLNVTPSAKNVAGITFTLLHFLQILQKLFRSNKPREPFYFISL
jgi:hypothetical protein